MSRFIVVEYSYYWDEENSVNYYHFFKYNCYYFMLLKLHDWLILINKINDEKDID